MIVKVSKTNSFTWSMFVICFACWCLYWVTSAFEFWILNMLRKFPSHVCYLINNLNILKVFIVFFPSSKEFWMRETVLSSTPVSQTEQHSFLGNKTLSMTLAVLPPHSKQTVSQLIVFYILNLPRCKMPQFWDKHPNNLVCCQVKMYLSKSKMTPLPPHNKNKMCVKEKSFSINCIHLVHKPSQILPLPISITVSIFTVFSFIFLTLTPTIPIHFTAIPHSIIIIIIYCIGPFTITAGEMHCHAVVIDTDY